MDESLYRQLLSRSVTSVLDRPTLDKGADYLRQGRVREIRFNRDGGDGGILLGSVKGSEPQPYTVGIRIAVNGGRPHVDTQCTCPLEGECKHVAAIALKMLGARPTDLPPVDARTPKGADLGPWRTWFESLEAPRAPLPRAPAPDPAQVFGILLRIGEGALPRLLAQPVWLKPNRRGGLGSPQPVGHTYYGGDPWERLTPEQFEHVARLRMGASGYAGSGAWYTLTGLRDESLLEILLASHPCFVDKPSAGRAHLAAPRALGWDWHTGNDGSQTLIARLDGEHAKTRLLRIDGVWYFDAQTREFGRVDGDARLVEAALRAPPLLPEHAPLVADRLKKTEVARELPTPARPAMAEAHRVVPVPVLTLRAFPVLTFSNGTPLRYHAGAVRLGFDYGGPRLAFAPYGAGRERRMHEGRLLEVVRDRSAEIAAVERLEGLGFIDAELLPHIPGLGRDALAEGDFVPEPRRAQLGPAEQLFTMSPRLREQGFRLETDSGFPFELLDEPQKWLAEVSESGNAWFDLSLGIDVGGERIDLLPVLRALLADPMFPLVPRKGEAEDAVWLVPIDARRRVPLPLARLRQLLAPLLEWLQQPPAGDAVLGDRVVEPAEKFHLMLGVPIHALAAIALLVEQRAQRTEL
ncbi:MAG: hypothetical protein J0L88_14775, partial [Xanthomonadales bacterium]|nr:hypothetical protein [Xanthomonadales bacterium]